MAGASDSDLATTAPAGDKSIAPDQGLAPYRCLCVRYSQAKEVFVTYASNTTGVNTFPMITRNNQLPSVVEQVQASLIFIK